MDICSATVRKTKNREAVKIKKIKMQKVSPKCLTRKDLTRRQLAHRSIRKFKLTTGLTPYKLERWGTPKRKGNLKNIKIHSKHQI